MHKLFTEFENESALRTYPFASGCGTKDTEGVAIGTGILIDAILYPVNPTGTIYLSGISVDGTVSISDSNSVIMTATLDSGASNLDFYDTTDLHRHSGTIIASSPEALASFVNVYEDREFDSSETTFASSCVFPIVNDGVTSMNVGQTGALDSLVTFLNEPNDQIRVSTDATGSSLRFDVVPTIDSVELKSIKHIYCIVDGKTPFRILKIPFAGEASGIGNTIEVYLDNITKQNICSDKNKEDNFEDKDTCDCDGSSSPCDPTYESPVEITDTYQVEVVDIPNGADNAFYLAVPNITGYDNPLSLTFKDGVIAPVTDVQVDANVDNLESLTDNIISKGVVLQVPGLEP